MSILCYFEESSCSSVLHRKHNILQFTYCVYGDMMPRRGISISEEQDAWLREHPEISLSGLVQKTLDELMD